MGTFTEEQQIDVIRLMIQEFLDYRLGIPSTVENITLLMNHILEFRREIDSDFNFSNHEHTRELRRLRQQHDERRASQCS